MNRTRGVLALIFLVALICGPMAQAESLPVNQAQAIVPFGGVNGLPCYLWQARFDSWASTASSCFYKNSVPVVAQGPYTNWCLGGPNNNIPIWIPVVMTGCLP